MDGIIVSGYGGPATPQITPASAAGERSAPVHPGLVTAHHPMRERWWEDFDRYARLLIEHVGQVESVCEQCFELEPDLGVLVVDFMSTDFAGHLGYARLDPQHPAARPGRRRRRAGAGVRGGRRRLRPPDRGRPRAVRRGADRAHDVRPRHEADVLGVPPEPLARGARPPALPRAVAAAPQGHAPARAGRRSTSAWPAPRARTRASLDALPLVPAAAADRAFADIDFPRTRAYSFATGGQVYLGESAGAVGRPAYRRAARDRARGRAPPRDRRAAAAGAAQGRHLPRPLPRPRPRPDRALDRRARPRRLAAAARHARRSRCTTTSTRSTPTATRATTASTASWPRAGRGSAPASCRRGRASCRWRPRSCACTGSRPRVSTARPIEAILAGDGDAVRVAAQGPAGSDEGVYSAEEEAGILERLRDLGYE